MTPAELVSAQRAALERRRREAEESNMQIYVLANLTANFVWSKGQRPSYDATVSYTHLTLPTKLEV